MWKRICNPSNCKVLLLNTITSLVLTLFLEYMERKSLDAVWLFIEERSFLFLYNVLIVFLCLSLVFVVKKKYFMYAMVSGFWALIALVNGIILNSRKTPFTAVDISMARSVLPVLSSYFEVWQIALMTIGIVIAVVAFVCLYLYSRDARKAFDAKTNLMVLCFFYIIFGCVSYLGVHSGRLTKDFDNLIAGYKKYGVAYSFCITALDTGVDRPLDYSAASVQKVNRTVDRLLKEEREAGKTQPSRHPNIIFIQLESFFDLTKVKGLKLSKDPLPVLHALEEEYISGQLKVPVYGAGTINTEFEAITGMSAGFFGTGEYPYRSILQKKVTESAATWLKELGYHTSVIHNNNAAFYDRDTVFSNVGFDNFISSENMTISDYNAAGWSVDEVLIKYIMTTLETTEKNDYIYTISVQGHGDYPTDKIENPDIFAYKKGITEEYQNQLIYYASQIHEMDTFIGHLLDRLDQYTEDVIVVAYGDHLPGLGFEDKDLTDGSKYKTPYFIWDNFGYSKEHAKEESGNLSSYQLMPKVLGMMGIENGIMNRFHQVMRGQKHYKKKMKLLQYDLLYGASFSRRNEPPLEASDLTFGLLPVTIHRIHVDEKNKKYLIVGQNFTSSSRVYINGHEVAGTVVSSSVISIPQSALHEGDEMMIHQTDQTNEKLTLNTSDSFLFEGEDAEVIPNMEEE